MMFPFDCFQLVEVTGTGGQIALSMLLGRIVRRASEEVL